MRVDLVPVHIDGNLAPKQNIGNKNPWGTNARQT
jgi:hypothetical protein